MTTKEHQCDLRPKDVWASGRAYEPYVGRWSRIVAEKFLEWLAVPPERCWVDVGCGTGALTHTILQVAAPRAIKALDTTEDFLSFARQQIPDNRATFLLGDARALPVETASCDAVVSGLMLNFVDAPGQAAREMARVARPGAFVAAYVWDYADRMQFLRHFWNVARALDPAAAGLDEGRRFPLCNPTALARLFQDAGFARIEVLPIDIWTDFKDFDDFWLPFLGGQGPAPSYTMSLSEEHRATLRERLRAALPFAVNGSLPLIARAWAVRGVR